MEEAKLYELRGMTLAGVVETTMLVKSLRAWLEDDQRREMGVSRRIDKCLPRVDVLLTIRNLIEGRI